MSRPASQIDRVLLGCVMFSVGVALIAATMIYLGANGISIELTPRWFSRLPTVHAQSDMAGMQAAKPAAAPSTSLTVTVDGKATTFSVADLNAMPQKTVKVHNEHTKADETYTGPALGDVLAKAGFTVSTATHREMLRSYVQAEGTDKYWVLYSLTEVEPSEHEGDVIVATGMNGGGLGVDGQIKLISSEDKKPQRWVRNLTAVTVKSAE